MLDTLGYQNIIPALMEFVPEIRDGYALMKEEYVSGGSLWDAQDYEEMSYSYAPDKFLEEQHTPGVTIVLEHLLVPLIIALSHDARGSARLTEIMKWLEKASNNADVDNAVAISICEPLITTYQSKIEAIYPYMGKKVREMCIMQFPEYKISEATKRIFGVS